MGDPFRLGQVLNNLLSNAIKFTEKGSIFITSSRLSQNGTDGVYQFTIKDSGIGIAQSQLSVIFQEFVQASSDTSRKFGGTGLGLSITKSLVEMQGGEISVESVVGEGTSFFVTIPYAEGTLEPSTTNKDDIKYTSLAKKNILVAEDVVINQIIIKQVLEDWGHHVVIANNGKEAIGELLKRDFDIIFMDIHMPEVDGYEATQTIRELKDASKAAIPIVALTANAFKNETDRFAEAGFNDYITKPFSEQKLFECLQHILDLNQSSAMLVKKREPKSVSDKKLYDLSALQGIDQNDKDFIREISIVLIKTIKTDIDLLKTAINETNLDEVFQIAHRLKSAIYSFGVKSTYKQIESIEFYAKTKEHTAKIPMLFDELSKNLLLLVEQLTDDFEL
jgi:CheY-like chemotaxis protein/HPt (histidine-containing phosphotransfer) domain-containing protein/anti-sigma regulatory factor (Ser/Thr protein kinase)